MKLAVSDFKYFGLATTAHRTAFMFVPSQIALAPIPLLYVALGYFTSRRSQRAVTFGFN